MLRGLLLSAVCFINVKMLTWGFVPALLFRFLLCQGPVHKERAGGWGWRAAVVQKERPAHGKGHGARRHVGGHHAPLRKARPGASQRHAAAALPLLSVSQWVTLHGLRTSFLNHFLDLGCSDSMIDTVLCSNIWQKHKTKTLAVGCEKMFGIKRVNCNLCLLRWFLRKYPGNVGCSLVEKEAFQHPIGKKTKYTCRTRKLLFKACQHEVVCHILQKALNVGPEIERLKRETLTVILSKTTQWSVAQRCRIILQVDKICNYSREQYVGAKSRKCLCWMNWKRKRDTQVGAVWNMMALPALSAALDLVWIFH